MVMWLLERLHFVVNTEKSFGVGDALDDANPRSRFREACGIEAFNGVDITPLRLSRRLVSPTLNDSDHQAGLGVGLVDLVNQAFLYDYRALRQWICSKLRARKWFRTCLRISRGDYEEFTTAIVHGRESWVNIAAPFVIVDDNTDTQWKAFGSKFDTYPYRPFDPDFIGPKPFRLCDQMGTWSSMALVTVVKSREGKFPVSATRPGHSRLSFGDQVLDLDEVRKFHLFVDDGQPHDENDYFTWMLRARRAPGAMPQFEVDATGNVTLRPRDLKWSRTWVSLSRPARLHTQSKGDEGNRR
jgi:hypothetical protein